MFDLKKTAVAVSLVLASASAVAIPMNGGVSFSSIDSSLFSWDSVADNFNFAASNAQVDAVSGDFVSVLNVGDIGSFFDFEYDGDFLPGKVWEFGALEFDLNSITNVFEATSFVGIEGVGTISDGIDSIESNWSITAQTAGGTFSWSASNEVSAPPSTVSEPSTIGIASLAFLAFSGFAAGRRKAK